MRRLRRVLGRRCSGLEVGSYAGAFLAAARDDGMRFEGLDVSPSVNAFTRSLGFAVEDGDFGTYRARRLFDVVAIWNTFDQLGDPRAAAEAAWRMLRPDGTLALRVPNGGLVRSASQRSHESQPPAARARPVDARAEQPALVPVSVRLHAGRA